MSICIAQLVQTKNVKWVMYTVFIAQWGLLGAVLTVEFDSSSKEE